MEPMTFEEEQNHVCSKENAQKLISELYSFILVTEYFINNTCSCEYGEEIKCLLRYILRLSGRLYNELEVWEILP